MSQQFAVSQIHARSEQRICMYVFEKVYRGGAPTPMKR